MQDTYGLREVWIPEKRLLKEPGDDAKPKCNIFMSEEFHTPRPLVNA